MTDDHQWVLETQRSSGGINIYSFNSETEKYISSHSVQGTFFNLDYAETTDDYAFSVIGSLSSIYVLKFESNTFSVLQTLNTKKNFPKPSITVDGSYIVFGDKTDVGNFLIQLYFYNDLAKEF